MSMTDDETLVKPKAARRSLGRGLGALLGDAAESYASLDKAVAARVVSEGGGSPADKEIVTLKATRTAPIEHLHPGRFQPRRIFKEEALKDLAASIREKGVLQPIVVRKDKDNVGGYEIIAGERRWRASQLAGLHEVPILVRDMSDGEALEISIIENVQREDLSPIEEGDGYQRLIAEFGHTHEDLARIMGKSRAHISNTLRLLKLPDAVKAKIDAGELSAGHARAVLAAGGSEEVMEKILSEGMSVREAEALARESDVAKAKKPRVNAAKDPNMAALEREISAALGLKVTLNGKGESGSVVIHYQNLDQLDEVMKRLCAVG